MAQQSQSIKHDAFESRRDGNRSSIVCLGVAKRTPGNNSQGNNRRQQRSCCERKQEPQPYSTEPEISHRSSAQCKHHSSSLSPTEAFQTRDRSKNYQSQTKTSMNNISVLEQLNYNPKITLPITVDLRRSSSLSPPAIFQAHDRSKHNQHQTKISRNNIAVLEQLHYPSVAAGGGDDDAIISDAQQQQVEKEHTTSKKSLSEEHKITKRPQLRVEKNWRESVDDTKTHTLSDEKEEGTSNVTGEEEEEDHTKQQRKYLISSPTSVCATPTKQNHTRNKKNTTTLNMMPMMLEDDTKYNEEKVIAKITQLLKHLRTIVPKHQFEQLMRIATHAIHKHIDLWVFTQWLQLLGTQKIKNIDTYLKVLTSKVDKEERVFRRLTPQPLTQFLMALRYCNNTNNDNTSKTENSDTKMNGNGGDDGSNAGGDDEIAAKRIMKSIDIKQTMEQQRIVVAADAFNNNNNADNMKNRASDEKEEDTDNVIGEEEDGQQPFQHPATTSTNSNLYSTDQINLSETHGKDNTSKTPQEKLCISNDNDRNNGGSEDSNQIGENGDSRHLNGEDNDNDDEENTDDENIIEIGQCGTLKLNKDRIADGETGGGKSVEDKRGDRQALPLNRTSHWCRATYRNPKGKDKKDEVEDEIKDEDNTLISPRRGHWTSEEHAQLSETLRNFELLKKDGVTKTAITTRHVGPSKVITVPVPKSLEEMYETITKYYVTTRTVDQVRSYYYRYRPTNLISGQHKHYYSKQDDDGKDNTSRNPQEKLCIATTNNTGMDDTTSTISSITESNDDNVVCGQMDSMNQPGNDGFLTLIALKKNEHTGSQKGGKTRCTSIGMVKTITQSSQTLRGQDGHVQVDDTFANSEKEIPEEEREVGDNTGQIIFSDNNDKDNTSRTFQEKVCDNDNNKDNDGNKGSDRIVADGYSRNLYEKDNNNDEEKTNEENGGGKKVVEESDDRQALSLNRKKDLDGVTTDSSEEGSASDSDDNDSDSDDNSSTNSTSSRRSSSIRNNNEDGISEYEQLRLERIRRNQERLQQLGLLEFNIQPPPKKKQKRPKKTAATASSSSALEYTRSQLDEKSVIDANGSDILIGSQGYNTHPGNCVYTTTTTG